MSTLSVASAVSRPLSLLGPRGVLTGSRRTGSRRVHAPRVSHIAALAAVAHPNGRCTIEIVETEADVGVRLCEVVAAAVKSTLAAKGTCAMAIPGGHMLTMLPGLAAYEGIDWSKVHMFYVNHKCVANDSDLATHKKSLKFLEPLGLVGTTQAMQGTDDAVAEAAAYEEAMRALGPDTLPVNSEGSPVFDIMLIGLGGDGHIGSLYPHKPEVLVGPEGPWVLPVVKSEGPSSITLTLPVINAAKLKVIPSIGRNMKTGGTKSAGVAIAIEGTEGAAAFPAQGVTDAMWIVDPLAASDLKEFKVGSDPLEEYCEDNPETDECRIYED